MYSTSIQTNLDKIKAEHVLRVHRLRDQFSNTVEDHISHVDEILIILTDAGVTLNINKHHIF